MKNIKSICKLATLYYATANIHLKKLTDAPENISPEACASCGGKCCKSMPGIAHPGQYRFLQKSKKM